MSRIAIVGGHGQIARLLIPLLADAGHHPVALVRNADYAPELERLGAEVGILDIEQDGADGFAEAFAGADAVVFAAGGGPDGNVERKKTVDLGGSLKSIEGAKTCRRPAVRPDLGDQRRRAAHRRRRRRVERVCRGEA